MHQFVKAANRTDCAICGGMPHEHEYLAAVITFLDRDSNQRTAITYPITRIELLSQVTDTNPYGLPKRIFEVVNDQWSEIK